MDTDIEQFVLNCTSCKRNKPWRTRQQGFLKPLPVPDRMWQEISMDFITDLPDLVGCNNILVFTDRLSKSIICEPCAGMEAEDVAKIFMRCFVHCHGIPRAIVSDRGPQFVGYFWKTVCKVLNIQQRLSTAYRPETDGSTERANQSLEEYLRFFTNYHQSDWAEWLPIAEFALNNRTSSATNTSPFFAEHGYHVSRTVCHKLGYGALNLKRLLCWGSNLTPRNSHI